MLLMFAAASFSGAASAQSQAYFYNEQMCQSTVEPLPGFGEYAMTETRYDPTGAGDNAIHFTRYDQAGTVLADAIIDQPGIDDRNIDLTYIPGNRLLLTAYYSPIGSGNVLLNSIMLDFNGNVLAQNLLVSLHPGYFNLYGADAVYDPSFNQFVVCGTATNGDFKPGTRKVAFVATIDMGLNATNMMFYDSNPMIGTNNDYDIATRVSLNNATGRYYVTGSVNVNKGGVGKMGVRNMLINPPTLATLWDVPLSFSNFNSDESGVDMAETIGASGGQEFFTLVNSTSGGKWWMLRIDPFTGNPINPFIETIFSYKGYGHNIALGNNPSELVISGMKYRAQGGSCTAQDGEATPFMATIDVSTPLATLSNHIEYYTQVGNSTYWSTGDFYQASSGIYPVPVYTNNFADRENMGFPYSVVTPLFGISGPLNTKYLDVNPGTFNGCKDITCSYGFDFNDVPQQMFPMLTNFIPPYTPKMPGDITFPNPNIGVLDCSSGYYRGDGTTGVANVTAGSLKIYPNPATDKISVELNADYKDAQIALYDVTGKRIAVLYNGNISSEKLQLELPTNISTGMYMLQVSATGNKTITQRITVTK